MKSDSKNAEPRELNEQELDSTAGGQHVRGIVVTAGGKISNPSPDGRDRLMLVVGENPPTD